MRKLSIFTLCFFLGAASLKAQEKATEKAAKPATTKKAAPTAAQKAAKAKKGTKSLANVPPPPPGANLPAPIPVPMDANKPPMPIDPHAAPPPPVTGMPGAAPLTPRERALQKGKGDGHNHGADGHPHGLPQTPPGPPVGNMPPGLPGQPAPPRPYDPSVDNVPVTANSGEFKFKEETHDFGSFEEGPTVETDFEFTNIGKEPITIKEAHASCGCTVPTWPKEPVGPGKTAKIHVTFNSKGRIGVIHKDVTVVSNAKQQPMMLHIGGEVKEAKKN